MNEKKRVKCMVRGLVEIELNKIDHLVTISTDNGKTAQIVMCTGESYYIEGKDQCEVADDLGITLGPKQ